MEKLIQDWEKNAQKKNDSTFNFITRLKVHPNPSHVDKIAKAAHNNVFEKIDCTKCARCCKTMQPALTDTDISRISAHLGMTKELFTETYLEKTEMEEVPTIKVVPCPFLREDKCSIYDVRPKACQEYPHTQKKDFATRRYMHTQNSLECPAVFHIIEEMKSLLNRRY